MRRCSLEYQLRKRHLDIWDREVTVREGELAYKKEREARKVKEFDLAEVSEARKRERETRLGK